MKTDYLSYLMIRIVAHHFAPSELCSTKQLEDMWGVRDVPLEQRTGLILADLDKPIILKRIQRGLGLLIRDLKKYGDSYASGYAPQLNITEQDYSKIVNYNGGNDNADNLLGDYLILRIALRHLQGRRNVLQQEGHDVESDITKLTGDIAQTVRELNLVLQNMPSAYKQ